MRALLRRWNPAWALSALLALGLGGAGTHVRASEPAGETAHETSPAVDGPLTPEQASASFQLEPGLRIELAAAEPTVDSPVAIACDAHGRMYVAENRGYPNGPAAGEPPMGRIARLEDVDGDGRFETRTTFADGLTFPNGVLPWNDGLIVTCAPDILYLEDTDGDGRSDRCTVWLTGFSTKGSTQLRVSHPTLGIDGWIYVTSGLTGGEVTCPAHPERAPLRFGRTDFRFRPDLSQYETCDGGGQFGLSFDDFGHRFICYNRVQVQHVVLESKYLRRNPHLAFSDTVQDCPAELAPEPLAGHGRAAMLYPISANVTTADSHAGTFTAACSVLVWRGDSLPRRYENGAFSCDPTGNLIHFDRLVPRGATFAAERSAEKIEFLASRDNWFRPVFLAHAPDGSLYVCDMYRKTIEHPDYLPAEIRKRTDFESGRGMGRIWRVVDETLTAEDLKSRRLRDATHADVGAWQRDLVVRRRFEATSSKDLRRADAAVRTALEELTHLVNNGDPREKSYSATVVSLLAFAAPRGLSDEVLLACLGSSQAAIREQALVAAEARLAESPPVARAILPMVTDVDPRVRFQWALAAGALSDNSAVALLAALAVHDSEDRWLRAAVLSSIAGREELFLAELLRTTPPLAEGAVELFAKFGRLIGAGQPQPRWANTLRRIVRSHCDFAGKAALLDGFCAALRARDVNLTDGSLLHAVVGDSDVELNDLLSLATQIALDVDRDVKLRSVAVRLLAHADEQFTSPPLLSLIDPTQPAEVQSAAIRSLAGMADGRIAPDLLSAERFATYTPAIREEVLSGMLSSNTHLPGLLAAIESGAVPAGAINSLRRKQLTDHKDAAIRDRARQVFGVEKLTDRNRVYEEYKSLLDLPPNSQNGREVFKKHCANCHRLDREGHAVGPDLFGIRNQPKETILLHVLIPEYEITQGFVAYAAETKDGRVLTGLLSSETPSSVTLKQALGKEETILRSDLERLVASKLSLMPQEFEKAATKQELADLLSYLKGENVGAAVNK